MHYILYISLGMLSEQIIFIMKHFLFIFSSSRYIFSEFFNFLQKATAAALFFHGP